MSSILLILIVLDSFFPDMVHFFKKAHEKKFSHWIRVNKASTFLLQIYISNQNLIFLIWTKDTSYLLKHWHMILFVLLTWKSKEPFLCTLKTYYTLKSYKWNNVLKFELKIKVARFLVHGSISSTNRTMIEQNAKIKTMNNSQLN